MATKTSAAKENANVTHAAKQHDSYLEGMEADVKRDKRRTYNIHPNVMMVMRHTERLDDFFPNWITKCKSGYRAYDLNMPKELPIKRSVSAYQGDPPITNTGDLLARIIGKGIYSTSYSPDLIYSSPALRCLQTANAIRSICKCEALIRVEPGLFENLSLYRNGLPQFATPEERAQFNVDEKYNPHIQISDLVKNIRETIDDYNHRVKNTLFRIAKMHQVSPVKKDQIVLIVGHASTVDLAAGFLAKRSRKSTEHDLTWNYRKIPVGSLLVLERVQGRRGWTPNLYAIPPVTYTGVTNQFDTAFVLRDSPVVKQ